MLVLCNIAKLAKREGTFVQGEGKRFCGADHLQCRTVQLRVVVPLQHLGGQTCSRAESSSLRSKGLESVAEKPALAICSCSRLPTYPVAAITGRSCSPSSLRSKRNRS